MILLKILKMKSFSRIYLTGFMGSGKSTLGALLAEKLGHVFVDLDSLVEKVFGMQIPEVFECHGEDAFRAAEAEALRRTFTQKRVVVAVGGGALAAEKLMTDALQNGLVVYLSASEATLVTRLRLSSSGRPLLKSGLHIRELLELREPIYRRAHVVLPVDNLSINQALHALDLAIHSVQSADARATID